MNKEEFLRELRAQLCFLSPGELDEALQYYDEYISEAENEEEAIRSIGSPKKAAEDFKNEYSKKKSTVTNEIATVSEKPAGPMWLKVVLAVLIISFGIPIVGRIMGHISKFWLPAALIAVVLIIVKLMVNKNNNQSQKAPALQAQTCSDIRDITLDLKSGIYSLSCGNGFGLEIPPAAKEGLISEIKRGVWTLSGDIGEQSARIYIPHGFDAGRLKINCDKAQIIIKDAAADVLTVVNGSGETDIRGVSAKSANITCGRGRVGMEMNTSGDLVIKCGGGKVSYNGKANADINISCGMGETKVCLKEAKGEHNLCADIGIGNITVDGTVLNKDAQIENNAAHWLKLDCGMGSIDVSFAEAEVTGE